LAIAPRRDRCLESAPRRGELVLVDAADGPAAVAAQNPSKDDEAHGACLIQQHGPTDGEFHKSARREWLFGNESNSPAAQVDRLAGAGRHHHSLLGHFVAHIALHSETAFAASVIFLFREIHASVPPPVPACTVHFPARIGSIKESLDYEQHSTKVVKTMYRRIHQALSTLLTLLITPWVAKCPSNCVIPWIIATHEKSLAVCAGPGLPGRRGPQEAEAGAGHRGGPVPLRLPHPFPERIPWRTGAPAQPRRGIYQRRLHPRPGGHRRGTQHGSHRGHALHQRHRGQRVARPRRGGPRHQRERLP